MATKTAIKRSRPPATKKAGVKKAPSANKGNGSADICFVIMPFGGWLDSYYSTVYSPAIEATGLEPHRADDLFRPSTIVNDIWSYTKKSKVLLADLTGKNANVFYELGLAHALAKPVILIAESMDDIPFDLRALRIILYDKNAPDWGRLLGEKIESSLKEVLQSPVEAVLPAFLEVRESNKPSISQEQKDLIELKQEMDLLRRSVASRESNYDDRIVRRPGGAEYARELISRYVRMGAPESEIIRRVAAEANAPYSWIQRQVQEYRTQSSPVVPVSSPPEASPPVSTSTSGRTPAQEAALNAALREIEKQQAESSKSPKPRSRAKPRPLEAGTAKPLRATVKPVPLKKAA
jgi:hypothetical protein